MSLVLPSNPPGEGGGVGGCSIRGAEGGYLDNNGWVRIIPIFRKNQIWHLPLAGIISPSRLWQREG